MLCLGLALGGLVVNFFLKLLPDPKFNVYYYICYLFEGNHKHAIKQLQLENEEADDDSETKSGGNSRDMEEKAPLRHEFE